MKPTILKFLIPAVLLLQACSFGDDNSGLIHVDITPPANDTLEPPPPPPPLPPGPVSDSIEQKAFWQSVVMPLLKNDTKRIRATVTSNVEGDWPYMINLQKDIFSLTAEDFLNNYKLLLTKDLISALSSQTYKNMEAFPGDDTVFCSFSVTRKFATDFEGSVRFNYSKVKKQYKLISINGVGGNFYECED